MQHGRSIVTVMLWTLAAVHPVARAEVSLDDDEPRCNVVIYLIDTLRADALGSYGYMRRSTTPKIDDLARRAVVFEQAYAPAPWTLPSVASLVTSTFPCEHRTLDNRHKLSTSLEPLASRMKGLGYRTLGFYANSLVGPSYGFERGFDELIPAEMITGAEVVRYLPEDSEAPLFLYIHNIEPHNPCSFAPERTPGFRDVSARNRDEIQELCTEYRRSTRVDFANERQVGATDNAEEQEARLEALTAVRRDYRELYDASVRLADSNLASVVETLKRQNLWDNTLFILLSDHGEEMNEHGGWLHDQSVYEELMHVPLVIRFPHDLHGGKRIDDAASLVDVLPTIFDYLGAPSASHDTRGRSLMPAVLGRGAGSGAEPVIAGMRWNTKKHYRPWKISRGDINVVVRSGHWKGIWNSEPGTLELYDLAADPTERKNLTSANPDLASRLSAAAREWLAQCGSNVIEAAQEAAAPDDETVENLRALGYID